MKNHSIIYYLCPDTNKPRGGVKVIYEHVDILNGAGFSACVLHQKKGFRCNWFDNLTTVSYLNRWMFHEKDFIVRIRIRSMNGGLKHFFISVRLERRSKALKKIRFGYRIQRYLNLYFALSSKSKHAFISFSCFSSFSFLKENIAFSL